MKKYRQKATFTAQQFDQAKPPADVQSRIFGKDKAQIVHFWVAPGGIWEGNLTIKPGQWMVIDQYGSRSVVDDMVFRIVYEEIPDAGEGGSPVHPHQVA